MKITSFNPLIVTKDAESAAKLFEELGFERRHYGHAVNTDGKETIFKSMNLQKNMD